MNTRVVVLVLCFAAVLAVKIPARRVAHTTEHWDEYNEPSAMLSDSYETHFDKLPASGELDRKPWSDTYWPSQQGGIAARWAWSGQDAFKYKLYSLDELRNLDEDTLKKLSPAEKFDIFRGQYDYPLVKEERKRTNPKCASWEGICHGWSPAALNFAEPSPISLQNGDGITVPFAASDIKGLLDFYQGQVAHASTTFLANRCNFDKNTDNSHMEDPECKDINAGAFHIAISNQIGINKKGFVADVTRDLQVWNQPVFKYSVRKVSESNSASAGAADGTVKEVTVETQMTYGVETAQSWDPTGTTPRTKTYNYRVELDSEGQIIGGEWLKDQWDRPDFLWTQEKPDFTGEWDALDKIYGASTGEHAMVFASDANANNSNSNHDLYLVLVSVGVTLLCVVAVMGVVMFFTRRAAPATSSQSLIQPLV